MDDVWLEPAQDLQEDLFHRGVAKRREESTDRADTAAEATRDRGKLQTFPIARLSLVTTGKECDLVASGLESPR